MPSPSLILRGFVKDISYQAHCTGSLEQYDFATFNINTASTSGLIQHEQHQLAYSKWVSPKRTRSYPFERIYNTFNASKIATVIPIIKDEGRDGDIDKIQYATFSWMNLLNVYVVLGYYDIAEKNLAPEQAHKHKITAQCFNTAFVNEQLNEILQYRQSALHWNRSLMERRFVGTFQKALQAYQNISETTGVLLHPQQSLERYIAKVISDFEMFKNLSEQASEYASRRETQTMHKYEFLQSGVKAGLVIKNYLGGLYHLTADEILFEGQTLIIQESKNSTTSLLPTTSDIKDGLFKLILYSNIDTLQWNDNNQTFRTRLKLTGKCKGQIYLHTASKNDFITFFEQNLTLSEAQKSLLINLQREAQANNIEIVIASNTEAFTRGGNRD